MQRRELLVGLGALVPFAASADVQRPHAIGRTPALVLCRDCMYWTRENAKAGACHRYPPGGQGWPKTAPEAYCGEGKAR